MLALLLFAAGCDRPPDADPPDKPEPQKPVTQTQNKPEKQKPVTKPEPKPDVKPEENRPVENPIEQSMNIKIYYPDDTATHLVEVERKIYVGDNDKYTAAVDALREEPNVANLTKILPDNAPIRSVTVQDGLAIVDFDGKILKGFVGGSTGEEFLIGSIVDTLTNFPEIERVKFLVDGQDVETLSGHMDLSTPLERMSDLIR